MRSYLEWLSKLGLLQWIFCKPERETFKFGNAGKLTFLVRYRISVLIGMLSLYLWISVVQCDSLTLLIGKDALRAFASAVCFDGDMFDSRTLGLRDVPLSEMRAGHYCLPLLDGVWQPAGDSKLWCLGNILEVSKRLVKNISQRVT